MPQDNQSQLAKLQQEFDTLKAEFYRNNFIASVDQNKFTRFNSRMKVPTFTALPSTCEIGEVGVFSSKLYVCSATNTWTSQT